ncbi:MAG TPA: sialidase family protein [Rubrobacteraceae bacterium]|nr:sialidase family protein [Rubrobacteraceae bacterium]
MQVLCVAVVLLVPQVAWASSYIAGPAVQVSGTSPFTPGCGTANQTGTNFVNSEIEPFVDVNPANGDNIVGSWQQDRWSDGGSRGLVAGVSRDNGQSWTLSPVRGTSQCTGNPLYERASDPWLSFSPNGSLHHVSLSFNMTNNDNAVIVNKSKDGGLTWSAPKTIIRDTDFTVFNDKESITADTNNSKFVYVIWDRLVAPRGERANIRASQHAAAFAGPIWFSRSTDGGNTYEKARQIFDPGTLQQTIGNQIVTRPQGDLVDIFNLIQNTRDLQMRGFNVSVIRSTDHGATWSNPIRFDTMVNPGVTDPDDGDAVRTGDIIPDIAVDPRNGNLYAVWQDKRFDDGQHDSIALSSSTDGGRTWSPAVKVNKTPTNIPTGNQQAFTPAVDVASDGSVAVTYYDFRNNTAAPDTLPTDYFVVHCDPTSDCSRAGNYGDEIRLTDTSFDMEKAPNARGYFIGDYEGLANDGTDFTPFFSQSHGTDPASIFFRRVGP